MNNWIEIKAILDVAPEDWSLLIDAFDRHGCPGTVHGDAPPSLSAYMLDVPGVQPRIDELSAELRSLGADRVETRTVPEEDWAEDWKQYFKPRRIGKAIVVRPTWEEAEIQESEVEIVLDPGQAFGTGDHPTTRLCLELMQELDIAGKTVADIGCGSGILSIAAVKLGASSVVASDLDAQSIEVSKANAALNGVNFDCVLAPGFEAVGTATFDVVLSNIISATLIRLAPDAYRHVKVGGSWLVSGVIEANWPDVQGAALDCGFTLRTMQQENEWIGAVFHR